MKYILASIALALAACAAPPQQVETYNYPQHVRDCRDYVYGLSLFTNDKAKLERANTDCLESRK